MKRTLMIIGLVLVITVSLIAGTLAYYQITIDKLAEGELTAKQFIFIEDDSDEWQEKMLIAPGETIDLRFGVQNFEGSNVTQTNMDVEITLLFGETKGGLLGRLDGGIYKLPKGDGQPQKIAGFEELEVVGEKLGYTLTETFQAESAESVKYQLLFDWPWDKEGNHGSVEIDTALAGKGPIDITVTAVGTQVNPNPGGGNEGPQP